MENPNIESNYKKAKRNAEKSYKKIVNVWSPAFEEHIGFNSTGFDHLAWKQRKMRSKEEQMRRFSLIPDAARIIVSSVMATEHRSTITTHETYRRNRRKIITSRADFWSFTEKRDGKTITVIVRQFEGGKKHFFSVF